MTRRRATATTDTDTAEVGGGSLTAEVIERLRVEFAGALELTVVASVVQACRQDLAGSPAGALPELVERLAREELTDRIRVRDRAFGRA